MPALDHGDNCPVFIEEFPRLPHRCLTCGSLRAAEPCLIFRQLRSDVLSLTILETDLAGVHLFASEALQPWCYKLSERSTNGLNRSGQVDGFAPRRERLFIELYVEKTSASSRLKSTCRPSTST